MLAELKKFIQKPPLFQASSADFWDDEHISKGMLAAHLNPKWDAATRNHAFVDRSADWIADTLPPAQYPHLLDLGCGPGLYAERFHQRGYQVTGIDISRRSLDYARKSALINGYKIDYRHQNYLELSPTPYFDCAVMIYCDYGALSSSHRQKLLASLYGALKLGGCLLLDVFTPLEYKGRAEATEWCYYDSGFWSAEPHLCLESFIRYDKSNTFLSQTMVITDSMHKCYNIWDQTFEAAGLKSELEANGFSCIELYADVAGTSLHAGNNVICALAKKGR